MGKPLPLSELIARTGEDAIRVQQLSECVTNISVRRGEPGVSRVTFETFETTPSGFLDNTGPVGLVIWLPRCAVNRIAEERAREEADRG